MPGKPEIDTEKLILQFKRQAEAGEYNVTEIARGHWREFCINPRRTKAFSREIIAHYREKLVAAKKIPDLPSVRGGGKKGRQRITMAAPPEPLSEAGIGKKVTPRNHQAIELTPDLVVDTMARVLEENRELKKEVKRLEPFERGYKNLLETARIQANAEKKRKLQGQRFKLAQQQGEIGGE